MSNFKSYGALGRVYNSYSGELLLFADFYWNKILDIDFFYTHPYSSWEKETNVICDNYGIPCTQFSQGDVAVFYYKFLLLQSIAVPFGGIVMRNNKGVIVHGKGSLEHEAKIFSEYFEVRIGSVDNSFIEDI